MVFAAGANKFAFISFNFQQNSPQAPMVNDEERQKAAARIGALNSSRAAVFHSFCRILAEREGRSILLLSGALLVIPNAKPRNMGSEEALICNANSAAATPFLSLAPAYIG
jgi:hypothetical protein